MSSHPPSTVLVTGAAGNLGSKLIAHLLTWDWCQRVIGIDRKGAAGTGSERVEMIEADLTDLGDPRWREAMERAEAVVHLAAQNPSPNAPWAESADAFTMSANLVGAALETKVRRFVFASSNHVMGQYKDSSLADRVGPGLLTTDLPPGPGTARQEGSETVRDYAYAASKLFGERLCLSAAALSGGRMSTVSVRIGWCQRGENRPETISAAGVGPKEGREVPQGGPDRDLTWFRNMWLSNRDYAALMEAALAAPAEGWPAPGIVVNGMSGNRGMPWDIETTRRLLGYAPQDDVWAHLA
jgi:nucleoside-diphosphate-sugar epimerase